MREIGVGREREGEREQVSIVHKIVPVTAEFIMAGTDSMTNILEILKILRCVRFH